MKCALLASLLLLLLLAMLLQKSARFAETTGREREVTMPPMDDEEDEKYGIDRAQAHPRAQELVPEEFFWDCVDELAPFGSDEGDTALAEFREWRLEHPHARLLKCLQWTIESVGEMEFAQYNDALLSEDLIREQVGNEDFDDQQYIFTLDVSVIATGFGQLVDEGRIEAEAKPCILRAIKRQAVWAQVRHRDGWEFADEYCARLKVLERVLRDA